MPCGKRRIELGVQLRNAWLVNSMLLNCEAWHNILKKDIESLAEVDLHLETGTLSIDYICTKRRLMYLHHIVSVPEDELIHKVYNAEKNNPVKGDWVLKVGDDREKIGLNIE